MDLDDAPTGGSRQERHDIKDYLDIYAWPKKPQYVRVRLLPGVFSNANYWVKTKKRDGSIANFSVPCPSFDRETAQRDSTIYDPWADHVAGRGEDKDKAPVSYNSYFYVNAIIRSKQEKTRPGKPTKAERKSGFKDKDSDTVTPVCVLRLSGGLLGKIKDLKELNTRKTKSGEVRAFAVNDTKFGRDILIKFDGSKAPADMYQVMPADKAEALTEEELEYLVWDIAGAMPPVQTEDEVRTTYQDWAKRSGLAKKVAKDEDDEPAPKKKKRPVEDDEDEDDEPAPKKKGKKVVDDFDDEDDEDHEPAPKKKAKAKAKSDDFDDEDDEDEDDEPAPKKKGKKAPVDDFDDEDEDDEDDEPAPKKKGKAKPKADDFDDEDDEDEEPAPKKKGKAKKVVDDFDDEDEDDEDDEPAPKKGKGKKSKADDFDDEDEDEDDEPAPKKKKKKAVEEDDDDNW